MSWHSACLLSMCPRYLYSMPAFFALSLSVFAVTAFVENASACSFPAVGIYGVQESIPANGVLSGSYYSWVVTDDLTVTDSSEQMISGTVTFGQIGTVPFGQRGSFIWSPDEALTLGETYEIRIADSVKGALVGQFSVTSAIPYKIPMLEVQTTAEGIVSAVELRQFTCGNPEPIEDSCGNVSVPIHNFANEVKTQVRVKVSLTKSEELDARQTEFRDRFFNDLGESTFGWSFSLSSAFSLDMADEYCYEVYSRQILTEDETLINKGCVPAREVSLPEENKVIEALDAHTLSFRNCAKPPLELIDTWCELFSKQVSQGSCTSEDA